MIFGIGTDIIEIDRVRKACERESFRRGVFTDSELDRDGTNARSLAGLFAAKEAVVKALGTGFSGIRPVDIQISKDESGKPTVKIIGGKIFFEGKIFVTISHCDAYATATAVAES